MLGEHIPFIGFPVLPSSGIFVVVHVHVAHDSLKSISHVIFLLLFNYPEKFVSEKIKDKEQLETNGYCLFFLKIRLKGEVGLTPGSNLTPKPRNDNMDPFMTEEQRKRVSAMVADFNSFFTNTASKYTYIACERSRISGCGFSTP